MIYETIVTTVHSNGSAHITPLGIHETDGMILLAPFRPSTTLNNLQRHGYAVINLSDDVRIFAGCLTGRRNWSVQPARQIEGYVLNQALSHRELEVVRMEDDELRPRFYCREVARFTHAPFCGFNRAQSAVVEAAILVSRLHMLPVEKIDREIEYLSIAIEKTAGPKEQQAWGWLLAKINTFRNEQTP